MIALLIAAASLLAQAYLFHDIGNSESNREAAMLERYRADAHDEATDCRWPAESDSSRTDESTGAR